ncbi:MAG TPA: right-handed parallel beta-helix repeat-containing protein, partial [bacterium]|nr:right-handed parallel beta-helix repeat-containing protein [bacterium]
MGEVDAATLTYTDTSATTEGMHYYRVTAFDGHTPRNESWFADTAAPGVNLSVDTTVANAWYVNDTQTTNDTYCSAIGYDTNSGLSAAKPKRTLAAVMPFLTVGDVVYIDAGNYSAGVTIDTNNVTIAGAGKTRTLLVPGAAAHLISVTDRSGVTLRDFACTGASSATYDGIALTRASGASVRQVVSYRRRYGLALLGCTGVTVYNCDLVENNSRGIEIDSSVGSGNAIDSSTFIGNSMMGIWVEGGVCGNTFTNNRFIGGNTPSAVLVSGNADSHTFRNNTFTGNNSGMQLSGCHNVLLENNTFSGNSTRELYLSDGADGNIVRSNRLISTSTVAVTIDASSNNLFAQNHIATTSGYGVVVSGASAADTFDRNNIIAANGRALVDSSTAGLTLDARRTWWGTTDSTVIRGYLSGSDSANVLWQPYRLGWVDTATGADSVAPAAPVTVTAGGMTGGCTVTWTTSGRDENGTAGATDTAGFRIYRSLTADTGVWQQIGSAAATANSYTDSGMTTDEIRYYRVTAYDNHATWPNESFYSDSVASAAPLYLGPTWYVSSDTGSDTSGSGSPLRPFRSIFRALQTAGSGETVCLMACANVWSESVVVTKDTVTITGLDVNRAVLMPSGNFSAVSATGRSGVRISNLTCTGIATNYSGIILTTATNCSISDVRISHSFYGVRLSGCSGIVVTGCRIDSCVNSGASLSNTSQSRIANNDFMVSNQPFVYLSGTST